MKRVGVVFRKLECIYFVNGSRHFCSLVGEVIKGCIALHSIHTFVFAVVDDFDNVVMVWLLQFKVNTGKYGRDVGMGNVRLNKALGVFKIVIVPAVLLPFAIEEFKGHCLFFLLVVSSTIFDNFDNPVRYGEGVDCMGFFDNTCVDVKDLVCALAIASGAKEYPRERARAHSVSNGWIIVGFNVGSKGGLLGKGSICLIPQRLLGGLFSQRTAK